MNENKNYCVFVFNKEGNYSIYRFNILQNAMVVYTDALKDGLYAVVMDNNFKLLKN